MAKFKFYDGTQWVEVLSTTGGTLTGNLTIGNSNNGANLVIGIQDDNYGLMPYAHNWNQIGSSNVYWYRSYITRERTTTLEVNNTSYNSWMDGQYGIFACPSASETHTLWLGAPTRNFGLTYPGVDGYVFRYSAFTDSSTGNTRYIDLPTKGGTMALTSDIPSSLPANGGTATYSRYVIGDNDAANPGGALLQSGTGREDSSPAGDTWIYYDSLGGTASPWGIRHDQAPNTISFVGAGVANAVINMQTGQIQGKILKAQQYYTNDIGTSWNPTTTIDGANVVIDTNGYSGGLEAIGANSYIRKYNGDTNSSYWGLENDDGGDVIMCYRSGSSYYSWTHPSSSGRLATVNDIPSSLPANGGTATNVTSTYVGTNEDSAMPGANKAGFYLGTSSSNGGDGCIIGMNWTDNNLYGAQLFIDCDPTYHIALRQRSGSGTWNAWKEIITENNIGSQSVNYANSAGAVDWSNVTNKANATQSAAGLMSAADKTNLDGIVASLSDDDSDNVVNRLKDVLSVFNDYPEGTTVLSALNSKLSLDGGTMTGIISRDAGGSWINARDHTLIKTTRTSSEGSDWHPAVGIKTTNGFWSFGSVGGETLCLSYDTDTDYSNGNNNSAVINFPTAGRTGTIALTTDIPSSLPANGGNSDTVDSQHADRFGWVYNSSSYGDTGSVSVNDMVTDGNSNATFAMINSSTDNPTGSNSWVHVWSQQWTKNTASSWVSQIAIGTEAGTGMWYRTNGSSSIVGKAWTRLIDSSNIGSQSVNYASSAGNADTVDGEHASAFVHKSGDTMTGALNVYSTGYNRANINLISVADVPNDLYFGSNGNSHWSISSRDSSAGNFIGLYDVGLSNWVAVVNYSTGVTDFKYRPTVNGTNVALSGEAQPANGGNAASADYATNSGSLDGNGPAYYLNYNNFTNTPSSLPANGGNSDTVDGLYVHSGRNNEANKIVRTDGNGYLQTGYINSDSGDENNSSAPARIWGTNGSDSYLRTYNKDYVQVGYANSSGSAGYVSQAAASPDASVPGTGIKGFYSWNTGNTGNSTEGYSVGLTVGSHPGDQNYGFQIAQNLWDDRLYVRRYNSGYGSWYAVAYTSDLSDMATQTWVSTNYQPKGNYLTSHQDISGKLDKSGGEMTGNLALTNAALLVQEDSVDFVAFEKRSAGGLSIVMADGEGETGYVLENADDGNTHYIATKDWVSNQGYLTAHQSLAGCVPYSGATQDVNIEGHDFWADDIYSQGDIVATKKDIQTALTPGLVGTATTASNINGYNGAYFNIGTTNNGGLYIFTYGNCMVLLPVYGLTVGSEYKVSACLVSASGSYENRVLTYRVTSSGNLQIYQKQNFIPTNYMSYLFKVKLY